MIGLCRRSFERTDAFTAAMGCFLLGCKVEETTVVLREIIFVFHELYLEKRKLPARSMDLGSDLYNIWKNELITIERIILKELGFSLYAVIDHPHQYILHIMEILQKSPTGPPIVEKDLSTLAESAWHYLHESKRIDLELHYESLAIAASAILLASKIHDIALPTQWWENGTDLHLDYEAMQDICGEILDLYELDVRPDEWIPALVRVDYLEQTYIQFR